MSYLLWHRDCNIGLASTRVVLRADEVPLFADAQALRDRLERLSREQAQRICAASEEARVQGHALGREEGRQQATEELAATIVALTQAAEQERECLRREIAELALQVVRKLLGQMPADSQLVALAETAARDMLPTETLTLFVHPEQCDAVRARLAASNAAAVEAPLPRLEAQPDPACVPGTCRIETEHGSVDASLEAQLTRLANAWGVNSR